MSNERIHELENKIKSFQEEIYNAEAEIRKIQNEDSSYWIFMCTEGNGDYWDEYYVPIGFTTRDAAERWCKENGQNGAGDLIFSIEENLDDLRFREEPAFFSVSEENYRKYEKIIALGLAISSLKKLAYGRTPSVYDHNPKYRGYIESVTETLFKLETFREELAKEIGLLYLSFQHVVSKNVF